MGDLSVDDDVADSLFGEVIRRFNARSGDEGEELLGMEFEALAQIPDPGTVWGGLELSDELVAPLLELALKVALGEFFTPVDQSEELSKAL